MNANNDPDSETCIVCGKAIANESGGIHLYHDSRRFTLCCPMCVQMFQRAAARFASGEHPQSVIEELIEEMKWKDRW